MADADAQAIAEKFNPPPRSKAAKARLAPTRSPQADRRRRQSLFLGCCPKARPETRPEAAPRKVQTLSAQSGNVEGASAAQERTCEESRAARL